MDGENASWGEIDGINTGTGNNPGQAGYHEGSKQSSGERGTGDGPGTGTTSQEGDLNEGGESSGNGNNKQIHYRETDVKKRVICLNPEYGDYQLSINAPNTAKHIKLEFSIAGEQSDLDLKINNACLKANSGNCILTSVDKNYIYIENVKKGDKIDLLVNVNFFSHCMMEVDYHESKK